MRKRLLGLLLLLLAPCLVHAMWDVQTLTLKAGYNAVYLKVTPADTRCSVVFAGADLESVTWWNRDRRDDGSGIAPTADMLNWYPGNDAASTFFRVLGGHAYIIKAKRAQSLQIVGVPSRGRTTLYLNEPNLVGLNLPLEPTVGEVGFYDYYAGIRTAIEGDSIAVVNPSAADPTLWNASQFIRAPHEAIWLTPKGAGTLEYMGPLWIDVDTAENAIRFLDDTETRRIKIKNVSGQARKVNIALRASAQPPAGQGTLLGKAAFMIEEYDWTAGYPRRVYKASDLAITTNLAAGATFELAIRPDLDKMPAANDGAYMAVLAIDDVGTVIAGNAMTRGVCSYHIGLSCNARLAAEKNPAGLWVGTVSLVGVNRVEQISDSENTWDSNKIEPVSQPFEFRLLVHVDNSGKARLLKEAFIATGRAADSQATILTSRDAAKNWRNAHPSDKIRRISSANFPNFGAPIGFTGSGFAHGGTMTANVLQPYDDKVNPFVHAYHPQHDNVRFRNKVMIKHQAADEVDGTGSFESWAVNRKITLTFANADPTGGNYDWNRTVTGGTYREDVTSLTKTPIHVEGAFRLNKVLDTHILTDL